jgi:hypothetical protein
VKPPIAIDTKRGGITAHLPFHIRQKGGGKVTTGVHTIHDGAGDVSLGQMSIGGLGTAQGASLVQIIRHGKFGTAEQPCGGIVSNENGLSLTASGKRGKCTSILHGDSTENIAVTILFANRNQLLKDVLMDFVADADR